MDCFNFISICLRGPKFHVSCYFSFSYCYFFFLSIFILDCFLFLLSIKLVFWQFNNFRMAFTFKTYRVSQKKLVLGNHSRKFGMIFKNFVIFNNHFVFLIQWKRNQVSITFTAFKLQQLKICNFMQVNNNFYYVILGNHSCNFAPIFNCLDIFINRLHILIYQKRN